MRNLAFLSNRQRSMLADCVAAAAPLGRDRFRLVLTDERAVASATRALKKLSGSRDVEGRAFPVLGFHRVPISFRKLIGA